MSVETIESSIEIEELPSATPQKAAKPASVPSYYRTVWRWHFFAGVLLTPFFLAITLTGGIYLYGPEVIDYVFRDTIFVTPSSNNVSYTAQIEAAQAQAPGQTLAQFSRPADPQRATMISFTSPPPPGAAKDAKPKRGGRRGDQTVFYVDPSDAKVLGTNAPQKPYSGFFKLILDLHRRLLIGTTGRVITELATSWIIILLITGTYLWWPQKLTTLKGVWWPRLSGKRYIVLRDLHTLAGIYLLPVILVVSVTGLFYCQIWNPSFMFVSNQIAAFASGVPVAPVAEKQAQEKKEGEQSSEQNQKKAPVAPPQFSFEQAIATSVALYPDRDVSVSVPAKPGDHYSVSVINDYARATYGPMRSAGFKLHRDSGEVLELSELKNNKAFWWHTWTYPLHVGSVLGQFSKAIWMLAMLILLALPVTGLWMWWERRPRGKTGLPKRTKVRLRRGMIFLMILTSVLMPIAGASILLVLLLDLMTAQILSRWRSFRTA